MCRPSLFYFTLPISEYAFPHETCLHHIKNYIHENGRPYADTSSVLCGMCLIMFIMHFGLYSCGSKEENKKELEEPAGNIE